ncbi:phosphatase PAP2 family protein [Streptosporangium saharense]|uniref:phosphatase PAP2 family protein n=1 Tax=Streptosporangium saharense TaxID=1706840 RepID=UPI00332B18F7
MEPGGERRTGVRMAVASVVVAVFLGAHAASGRLTLVHVLFAGVCLLAVLMLDRWRPVVMFFLPLFVLLGVYDLQRFLVARVTSVPVHVAELHAWELAWFGIPTPTGRVTPAAWFQTHTSAVLDLVCGLAYLGYFTLFLAMAAWWRFGLRRDTSQLVTWAALLLHLGGYLVHLTYPTAPPWYVDHYGLGPAVLTAQAEAAGAARFDELLGISWFASSYTNSANVFGACPSLHVGQVFLAVLFAWRFRSLRIVATTGWLVVVLASVYLNHHYLVDGLVGMAFAVGAYALVVTGDRRWPTRLSKAPRRTPAASEITEKQEPAVLGVAPVLGHDRRRWPEE